MINHMSYHKDDAVIAHKEIINDSSPWWSPMGLPNAPASRGDFDYAKMRFLNRNLNYFYLESMISYALKNNYKFNPMYNSIINFCEKIRTTLGEYGPFGRMCVWNLEPGVSLLPHIDNWPYHRGIRRYIFCISEHYYRDVSIVIDNTHIPVEQGLLFGFSPSTDLHEFRNYTDKNFYFLGWDYWDVDKLKFLSDKMGIKNDSVIEYTPTFGDFRTKCEFVSQH